MEKNTRGIDPIIKDMDMVKKHGQMELFIKDNMFKD